MKVIMKTKGALGMSKVVEYIGEDDYCYICYCLCSYSYYPKAIFEIKENK